MKRSLLVILFTILLPVLSASQSYYSESGFAGFRSVTSSLTFNGTTESLIGKIDLENNTVDFYFDLLTLKTGIGKRDRDMYEVLEVEKYPFAEFFGELVSDFDPNNPEEQEVSVKGTFKVHGVEREVTIDGIMKKTDDGLKVKANWTLTLTDYGMEPPSLLNYKVNNDLNIGIRTTLKPEN